MNFMVLIEIRFSEKLYLATTFLRNKLFLLVKGEPTFLETCTGAGVIYIFLFELHEWGI